MTPEVEAALTTPIVAAAAVGALVLLLAAWPAVGALLTVAHEAGHVAVGVLTGHRVLFFEVANEDAGRTVSEAKGWGPARILMTFAGYVTPPLLGLGGAALFDAGQILPLLWAVTGLLVLTLPKAEREWTTFIVLLLAAATGYVALYGTPMLQVGFAAGLVWLLLFGGVRDTATAGRQKGTDPHHLYRDTLIPGMLWKAGFIAVAIVCLWKGAELMVP
jgi:hypothetical protein